MVWLEKLHSDLVAAEQAASEALAGDQDGAGVWIAVAAEHFLPPPAPDGEERVASRSYLVTVLADRVWDLTHRNLSDAERAMLASLLPSEQVSLKDFVALWSFYMACEVRFGARSGSLFATYD